MKRIALLVVAFACVIGLGYAATLAGHSDDRDDNDTLQITIRDFCDIIRGCRCEGWNR